MTERPDTLRDHLLTLPALAAYGEPLRAAITAMPEAGTPLDPADMAVLLSLIHI